LILVDTSVWIRHFRSTNAALVTLLDENRVAMHDFVIGELACGQLKHREEIVSLIGALPRFETLPHQDVLYLVNSRKLYGTGIGWIDTHLLASTLDVGARIWSFDKSLENVAQKLSIHFK